MNALRTLALIASCSSFGRSAKVALRCTAWISRSIVLGTPFEAAFKASNASATAEKMIACMTSVAAFGMIA